MAFGRFVFVLLPLALFAGQPRYARLGAFDGPVEIQLSAAEAWMPAERNLPLPEGAWIRTGTAGRVEIEFDDGGVWRLGPDSQGEISDDSRLSTGQRVTLLSLDHGLGFFTGQTRGIDSVVLAVPGAHVSMAGLAHVRFETGEGWSQVWVRSGAVRFSCPAAELDLVHGQTTRVEPANPSRFMLDRDNPATELDRWSAERDEALANPTSALHVMERNGVADLDAAGQWIATDAFGTVWQPKSQEGWEPFRNGHWRWYPELGYTWVSDDVWGWLPYHYGRWARTTELGWFWVPNVQQVFKPGDVYWIRGPRATLGGDIPSGVVSVGGGQWIQGPGFAGWGPLAPGEQWTGSANDVPRQYAERFTTYGAFTAGAAIIDPAGFTGQPKDPLRSDIFVTALPSPPLDAATLEATRPLVQAGSTRLAPVLPGVTYQSEELPVRTYVPVPTVVKSPAPPPPPVIVMQAPPEPPEVVPELVPYPVAVYGGIVVGNVSRKESSSAVGKAAPGAAALPPPSQRPIPPESPIGRRKRWQDRVEYDLAEEALRHEANPALQVQDLDTWKRRYPHSDYENERNYYYVSAYARLAQPQPKLFHHASLLLSQPDIRKLFDDTAIGRAQVLNLLYLTTTAAQTLPASAVNELQVGRAAADKLIHYLPEFFTPEARPANVNAELWTKARSDMESAAKRTLAMARRR